jgi:hypothetical protein
MKFEFLRQIFEKYPNVKFHENLSSVSRVVPRGRKDGRTDRQTDRYEKVNSFRSFANTPKIVCDKDTRTHDVQIPALPLGHAEVKGVMDRRENTSLSNLSAVFKCRM